MEPLQPAKQTIRASDRKIISIFVGLAFLILLLLSVTTAGVYYWYKNSDVSKKLALEKDAFLSELTSEFESPTKLPAPQASPGVISEKEGEVSQEQKGTTQEQESKTTATADAAVNTSATKPRISYKEVCYKYTVYEEPFKSSKCYTADDYTALSHYLSEYRNAEFSKESAESTIDFVCGKDYFEDSCEDAKDQKNDAKEDMVKYSGEINQIISRGW